jgi:hypothetical protein
MRQPRPIVRLVAAVLAVTQLTGCGSAWQRPEGVAPADAVTTWHPDSIRVVTGDRRFKLHDPSVIGDSLAGRIPVTRVDSIGVLRGDVATVRARGRGAVLVLRDSSVLEITELWERGDSLGGPGVPRRRWERVVVPLPGVKWIELSALPGQDSWRHGVQFPLAQGQTVRVRLTPGNAAPARSAVLRGEVSRMTADSLVMTVNGEERRIVLASVSRLEVLRGHGNAAGWGVLIGVVVGAAGGAAVGAAHRAPAAVSVAVTVPAGVLAGGFLGLIVGAASRTERWQTVPLPGQGQAPPP